jgi:hypothetical protein
VHRIYLGSGNDARLAALLVEERRLQEQRERQARRAEQEKWDSLTAALESFAEATDRLAHAALVTAGYHEHRGQWRRRMLKVIDPETGSSTIDEQTNQVMVRAHQGDQAVLPQLQELLDSRPDLWNWAGDLAAHAREALLGLASGDSLLVRESIRRKMDQLAAGLGELVGSPLERLLIERVVLCWVQVHLADLDAVAQDQAPTPRATHARQRLCAAQKRYLQAVKALATVQKMLPSSARPAASSGRGLPETGTQQVASRSLVAATS